jgi:hypothetical protein
MKVKELIAELQKQDGEQDVLIPLFNEYKQVGKIFKQDKHPEQVMIEIDCNQYEF